MADGLSSISVAAREMPLQQWRRRRAVMRWVRPVIAISTPLFLWEFAAALGLINTFLFPPPTEIFTAVWTQTGPQGQPPYAIIYHASMSFMRIAIGVGLALVVGGAIGLLIGLTRWGRAIFQPIVSAIMPVPTLAWTPVLLLVLGIDNRTTITVVMIATSFEIIYNVVAGIEMLSARVFWVVRSMGATATQTFFKVILPGILPYLITGLRLGIGFAWRALIAAEMLAASSFGLGFMIFDAAEFLSLDIIFGGIMLIALFGFFLENVVIGRIEAVTVRRWGVQVEH